MEVVKLREDAGEYVYYLGTDKHAKNCPKSWAEGATDYAKALPLILWDPRGQTFEVFTLEEWLEGDEHLLSTLLLLGPGARGKSKLMHMLAQELCTGYEKPCYIFAKAIDPLGMLSHTGEVRKSAVLCMTDFKFRTARKGDLDAEDLKSLLDVVEGGSIPDTRYRPAIFPEGLCRILALNDSNVESGAWFSRYGKHGIASLIAALAAIPDRGPRPFTAAIRTLPSWLLLGRQCAAFRRTSKLPPEGCALDSSTPTSTCSRTTRSTH